MQFSTQFHHFTHDNYGWRLKFFSFGEIGNSFNGSYNPSFATVEYRTVSTPRSRRSRGV
jgi:hypothetical protein